MSSYAYVVQEYFENHFNNGKWYVVEPSGKVPLKYWAVPLMVQGNADNNSNKSYNWALRIMPSGKMMLEMTVTTFDVLEGTVEAIHTKARVVNNLDDLWSVATTPTEIHYLKKMLMECGRLLAGDETLFYKVVEEDPVPF